MQRTSGRFLRMSGHDADSEAQPEPRLAARLVALDERREEELSRAAC